MSDITINIVGKEDVSPEFRKVTVSLDSITDAMARVIESEKQFAINAEAEKAVAGMTKAEKEQFSAAYELDNANQELGLSFTEIQSAINLGKMALGEMKKVYDETIGVAQEYDQTIMDVMIATGGNAEESSRLVNVIDDVGISYETLKTAMKMASKDGIEPNIESLAKLSDEYLKLSPGVERNQFLMDKFGKSGMDMARAMELGGDKLLAMNAAMNDNLILTDEEIAQSEEYRKNLDNISDSAMGLKVVLGNELIPVGNELIQHYTNISESLQENGYWYTLMHQFSIDEIADNEAKANAVDSATSSYTAWAGAMQSVVQTQEQAVEVDSAAVEGAMQVHDTYVKLGDKMVDLQADHDDLLAKKQELLTQGWWPESDKIQEVNDKLAENEQKQKDVTTAMQGTLAQMILNTAAAGLDAEGQLALARATGQIDEASYQALSAQMILKKQYEDGTLTADQYAQKTLELRNAVGNLESKDITITVNGIFNEIRNLVSSGSKAGTGVIGGGQRYASGTDGWQQVPGGYPDDTYPIMLSSYEHFAVIPAGQQPKDLSSGGGMGGGIGGGGNQFVYAPTYSGVSFGDESEIKNRIYPWFLEMLETAKANGHV